MSIDFLRSICASLKGVQEDIKWDTHLCFCVKAKIFAITSEEDGFTASFKCDEEDFTELIERDSIIPAPHLARNKWVYAEKASALNKKEWEHYIRKSYQHIASKLPKKTQKELGLI
jgi:predicted DNA-binding protein (MmcQ/YjbR family)